MNESVLRWAIDRSNTSIDDLRSRFPRIHEWLRGDSLPTMNQLEELSRATTTPFGSFFLSAPPEEKLTIPHFRTLSDAAVRRPSADLLDTIHTMERRQDWMRDYLIDAGESPVPFVGSVTADESAETVAQRMRNALRIDDAWAGRYATWEDALKAMRKAMEDAGVLVFANGVVGNNTHRVLDPDEFRGFVMVDEYAPLVFVNGADPKAAQMFTLAHELAHVFFGQSAIFDLWEMEPSQDQIEKACNRVAAEFLVPAARFLEGWQSATGESQTRFEYFARVFKVSAIVVARRAVDLNLINRGEFLKFYRAYIKNLPESSGGRFNLMQPLRVGSRFGAAVIRAVREGRTLHTEAYSLTGLRGKSFETYAASVET